MADLATLRNKTTKPISILHEGKQIIIKAQEELTMEAGLALKFYSVHGDRVERVDIDDLFGEEVVKDRPREIWLANVTGNPDAPDTLTETYYDTKEKEWKQRQITNPFKKPRPVVHVMKGAEQWYMADDGEFASEYLPPKRVDLPAYKFAKVDYDLAMWVLGREQNSNISNHTAVKIARELPEWRPSGSWSVDDLRVWIRLCRPEYDAKKLGLTEAQIKNLKKQAPQEADAAVRQAKMDLLKKAFFCLVDPTVPLPTREEFESFRNNIDGIKTKAETKAEESLLEG